MSTFNHIVDHENDKNFYRIGWWKKNYGVEYDKLTEFAVLYGLCGLKLHVIFWHLYNNVTQIPTCECGKNLTFTTFKDGYRSYCSVKCQANSKKVNEKRKNTVLKKYGTEYIGQNSDIKDKIKKSNLEKYGVENASSLEVIKEKVKQTNLERYGTVAPLQNEEIKEKVKQTNLEKYGVENPWKSKEIRNKISQTNLKKHGSENVFGSNGIKEKVAQTNLERYGVVHPIQNENIKEKIEQTNLERYGVVHPIQNENIKEKVKQTNLERYGTVAPLQNEEIKEKVKQTNLERYRVENPWKSKEIRNKISQTNLKKYGSENYTQSQIFKEKNIEKQKDVLKQEYNQITFEDLEFQKDLNVLKIKCLNGHVFDINRVMLRYRYYNNQTLCTICNDPKLNHISEFQNDVYNFIKEIYDKHIETNDRKIITPKELDIYLPDLKIAIECNGIYWHSDKYCDKNYHLNKFKKCNDLGIKLIQIWEDDWYIKKEILKSRLKNLINVTDYKIHARKCVIAEISNKVATEFLKTNHLQGKCVSQYNIGLYHNNELVSVMTFGKLRKNLGTKNETDSFELLRFCNKLNTVVSGAASKMFLYFKNTHNFTKVISYSDLNWGTGFYEKIGFKFEKYTTPGYWWLVNGIRENRFKYRKDILIKNGYNADMTEEEIMHSLGHIKIYSSGNAKWIYSY